MGGSFAGSTASKFIAFCMDNFQSNPYLRPPDGYFLPKMVLMSTKKATSSNCRVKGLKVNFTKFFDHTSVLSFTFFVIVLTGNALSLFAKGLDHDEVMACANAVTGSGSDGISVTPDFLQNDKDPGAAPTRYYVLRNCPIPAVNGRYMDGGFHEGAPVYRNVREWALGEFFPTVGLS